MGIRGDVGADGVDALGDLVGQEGRDPVPRRLLLVVVVVVAGARALVLLAEVVITDVPEVVDRDVRMGTEREDVLPTTDACALARSHARATRSCRRRAPSRSGQGGVANGRLAVGAYVPQGDWRDLFDLLVVLEQQVAANELEQRHEVLSREQPQVDSAASHELGHPLVDDRDARGRCNFPDVLVAEGATSLASAKHSGFRPLARF